MKASILCIVSLSLCLAACGSKPAAEPNTPEVMTPSAGSAPQAPTPAPAPAPATGPDAPAAPSGPECGGYAGLSCPAGQECVDDPSDGCDPAHGGFDCGGICQPSEAAP